MSNIPLVTPLFKLLKNYLTKLEAKNVTELPSQLQSGLEAILKAEEKVLVTLRNYRAMYKAPRWMDSNTYFNCWFVLTNQRVLILRNSSSVKIFRDIPLHEIHQTHYEMDRLEPRITLISKDREDRVDFFSEAVRHCEGIEKTVDSALIASREKTRGSVEAGTMFCHNCGSKIPRISKFCSECGQDLKQ